MSEKKVLFNDEDYETFSEAIETWGVDAQFHMLIEELGELIVASQHHRRGKIDDVELSEEIADVQIVIKQITEYIGREDVEDSVTYKMERLRNRIEEAEK